jgi:hypothetical protein
MANPLSDSLLLLEGEARMEAGRSAEMQAHDLAVVGRGAPLGCPAAATMFWYRSGARDWPAD